MSYSPDRELKKKDTKKDDFNAKQCEWIFCFNTKRESREENAKILISKFFFLVLRKEPIPIENRTEKI